MGPVLADAAAGPSADPPTHAAVSLSMALDNTVKADEERRRK
jgi:hypothetical protein